MPEHLLNAGIEVLNPDHDLTERDRYFVERMAQAVKKVVDDNQCLDDWKIGKAVFMEFKGELEQLDIYIDEHLGKK
tara:strand:- start:353 stop:580 length:228 start_codon:yes stop_codon:yes gene_type:complete